MSIWKRIRFLLKWTSVVTAVLFLAAVIYFSPQIIHIYKWNPVFTPLSSKFYGEAENLTQAQSEDIEFLGKLISIDRSFDQQAQDRFHRALDEMLARAGHMTDAEFALEVARAVALADNGHTNVSSRSLITLNNRLPVRFYWFDGHLHIVRAHPEHRALLGAEVIAIGGIPSRQAVEMANVYFGGPDNWRSYLSTSILESPALLEAAGISDHSEATTLLLKLTSGETSTVTLAAHTEPESFSLGGIYPWMVLSSRSQPAESTPWASISDHWDKPPGYLARPDVPYFFRDDLTDGLLYVHVSFTLDYQGYSITEFWESLELDIQNRQFQKIVLDLRNNPGGDLNTTVGPVSRLPNHLSDDGRLYIVTSHATFSAAIVSTSVAKFHGGDRAVIIGERVGDRDQFWAEGGLPFRLPHSGIAVSFATGYHDWVNGCTGRHPYCYDGHEGVENPIDSLDPDIPIPLKYSDYERGHDPIMHFIMGSE